MAKTLIHNARLENRKVDLLISNGIIEQISPEIVAPEA